MVLNLPGTLLDVKETLRNVPVIVKSLVEGSLRSTQVVNSTKKLISFSSKSKNLLLGNGFTEEVNKDFSRGCSRWTGSECFASVWFR